MVLTKSGISPNIRWFYPYIALYPVVFRGYGLVCPAFPADSLYMVVCLYIYNALYIAYCSYI